MHAYSATEFIKLWNYGCTYFLDVPLIMFQNRLFEIMIFFAGDFWLLISSTKNTVKSAQYKFKTILCVLLFFPFKLLCNWFRLVSLNSKFGNKKFCSVLFFFIIYYISLFHYSFTYRYILFIYRWRVFCCAK